MKYIQFFLTVNGGKWLIAEAISCMDSVKRAKATGRLVFKGSTTVSCAAELVAGVPLRISGRITARGAVAAKTLVEDAPHAMLLQNGAITQIDDYVEDALLELEPDDIMITGANMIDADGGAAMLAGSPAGNHCGKSISAMATEGFQVIIAAGLEKMIPGRVADSVITSRRKGIALSQGMACGLFPIHGQIITELQAIPMLADVQVRIIGRGGLDGGEGGTLFQAWGKEEDVDFIWNLAQSCNQRHVSGNTASLVQCQYPSYGCGNHESCCYKSAQKG